MVLPRHIKCLMESRIPSLLPCRIYIYEYFDLFKYVQLLPPPPSLVTIAIIIINMLRYFDWEM
ncbi:hypothetical protein BDB01DRAFT_775988 [Pilobolus umbonatus]|nr:hypothetical protein BDB01DRAFT_775988 [Pilobolus umbonatus]